MQIISERLDKLTNVVDVLEKNIRAQKVTKTGLDKVQANLDSIERQIDSVNHATSPSHYALMLEVQSLIHYAKGDIEKATVYANSIPSYLLEGETPRTELISKLISAQQTTLIQQDANCPEYFTVSTTRLVVLSLLTGTFYLYYWFFRNWMSVKRYLRSRGQKGVVLPRLASAFFPLTSYDLFTRVRQSHADYGLDAKLVSAGAHAWGVFLLNRLFLSFVPVVNFQKHMNNIKKVAFGDERIQYGTTVGEVIWVILSIIFWILVMIGAATDSSQSTYYNTDASTIAKGMEVDSLTDQYNSCIAELDLLYATVDQTDQYEIDNYTTEYNACEDIRLRQNAAAAEYNRLIGQ